MAGRVGREKRGQGARSAVALAGPRATLAVVSHIRVRAKEKQKTKQEKKSTRRTGSTGFRFSRDDECNMKRNKKTMDDEVGSRTLKSDKKMEMAGFLKWK